MKQRNATNEKPVIDAVNDAVSALSDLVRSLRGARRGQTRRGPDIKTRAKTAAGQVKAGAHEAADEARRAGRSLRTHFERAWHALNGSTKTNGSARAVSTPRAKRRPARSRA